MIKSLTKYKTRSSKLRKIYFLVGEFFLLVTVMVGIAAAARYIINTLNLRNQNLQNLAGTPQCLGTPPSGCYVDGNFIGSCNRIKDNCQYMQSHKCSNGNTTNCCWDDNGDGTCDSGVTTGGSCISNACLTVGKTCCAGNVEKPEYTCPGTNKACVSGLPGTQTTCTGTCQKFSCSTSAIPAGNNDCAARYNYEYVCCSGGTAGGGNVTNQHPCTWKIDTSNPNGGYCTGSDPINCIWDSGGGECFTISHCTNRTDPLTCADPICNSDGLACGVIGEPPPGGEPPPVGGGFNICDAGSECKKATNCPACDGGGCNSCEKPNEPGICCPLAVPPIGEPTVPGQPTAPVQPTGSVNPTTALGTPCSPESGNVCKDFKIGDVCELATQNKCTDAPNYIKDASGTPICSCGMPPTGIPGTSPSPGPQISVTPGIPSPTPTIDPTKVNWYEQGTGALCNSQTYLTFYSDKNCRDYNRIGFQTENLPDPVPCNPDGIGDCYRASGEKVQRKPNSYRVSGDNACHPATDIQNAEIYRDSNKSDEPNKCSFKLPPTGSISASITLEFDDDNDKKTFNDKNRKTDSKDRVHQIAIYVSDKTDGSLFVANKIFTKKDFAQDNFSKSHTFDKLFNDHQYEVYVKAIKNKKYMSSYKYILTSCDGEESTGNSCLIIPEGGKNAAFTIKITKRLPEEERGDKASDIFNKMMEEYNDDGPGKCNNALCVSEKLKQFTETTGLQSATCDPTIPGGCEFSPEDTF